MHFAKQTGLSPVVDQEESRADAMGGMDIAHGFELATGLRPSSVSELGGDFCWGHTELPTNTKS